MGDLNCLFLFPAEPVIQFTKERIFVAGPVVRNAHVEARITVTKTGDPFTRSKVRVYTLDGSAKAGKGYQAMTQVRKKYFPYVGADNLKRATSMYTCRRFQGPVYFWNGFGANLEYL